MSAALGVLTCNRPAFCEKTLRAVQRRLALELEAIYVYDDASDPKFDGGYRRAFARCPDADIVRATQNRGCAAGKNVLLNRMLFETDADWLFLLEDDIVPRSSEAVSGYIAACEQSGWAHLSYAHHGPANRSGPVAVDGAVALYRHYVGAFCIYGREALQTVGLFDESFTNAFEHVEHTLRLARAGFTDPRPWHVADATGSEQWLSEIPGSIEHSAIRPRPDWKSNIESALRYWRSTKPETFRMLWPA